MAKVDNIDTSDFVLNTKYNTDKIELENEIRNISGLARKANYINTKIIELKNKTPDISGLVKKTIATLKLQN